MGTQVNKFVKSMANVAIPEDILQAVDMKGLLQDFSSDYQKLDDIKSARARHESRNFLSRWWNKSELENAKLDAVELQASFSKRLGQLMVLSVAQSKQLATQQEDLAIQQELINEQTQQLAESSDHIQRQQQELSEQNAKLEQLVNEYFELKGLTQEGAKQLIHIANEVKHTKDELLSSVDQQIIEIHQSHRLLQQEHAQSVEKMLLEQSELRSQVESELDAHEREVANAMKISLDEIDHIKTNIYQSMAATEAQLQQALQQAELRQQSALAEHDTRWQVAMIQQQTDWTQALDVQQAALSSLSASTTQQHQQLVKTADAHQEQLQAYTEALAQLRSDMERNEAGWQKCARSWLISTVAASTLFISALAYLAARLHMQQALF